MSLKTEKIAEKKTTRFCLTIIKLLPTKVHWAHLRSNAKEIEERGFCEALSTPRIASCRVWVSNLFSVIRKPHVPSSMAYILYALFTVFIPKYFVSLFTVDLNSLLVAKKNNNPTLDWYHVSHSLSSYLSFSPCIASLCLSFYLNSWYARGRKCVVIVLWYAAPAFSAGGTLLKGHSKAAMPCYIMLCYTMHAQYGGHYGNAEIMQWDY